MDLALEFGIAPRRLRRELTERDLFQLGQYRARRGGLPLRRIEVLLARIAYAFDVGFMGKSNARLSDYLSTEQERDAEVAETAEMAFGGAGTRIKGNVKAPVFPIPLKANHG